jgi:hypothetical protein
MCNAYIIVDGKYQGNKQLWCTVQNELSLEKEFVIKIMHFWIL